MIDPRPLLQRLGIDPEGLNPGVYDGTFRRGEGKPLESLCPADGSVLARVARATKKDYDAAVSAGMEAFPRWRMEPAPRRGEVVRRIGDELRRHKQDLGTLVSLENGKILTEGLGEVQEMIDMADFSVGLSRQLYGLVMQSERPGHRMVEQWHPLGTVGVITAFNFPVAVWAWNAFVAGVCGDVVLWKPASPTPLCALAVSRIADRVLEEAGWRGVFNLVVGSGAEVGDPMLDDPRAGTTGSSSSTTRTSSSPSGPCSSAPSAPPASAAPPRAGSSSRRGSPVASRSASSRPTGGSGSAIPSTRGRSAAPSSTPTR